MGYTYRIFLAGGVYFATGPETHRQFRAGSSSPDRKDDDGNCNTLSVSLSDRRSSARQGLAFGIGEIDEFMSMPAACGAEEIRRRSRIESVGARRHHERAAPLCARFLAEAIWTLSSMEGYDWTSALRYNVPAVADAARPGATYDNLPHRQVLEQLTPVEGRDLSSRQTQYVGKDLGDWETYQLR
jgi:hypothetical protein